jgi:metalloprotease
MLILTKSAMAVAVLMLVACAEMGGTNLGSVGGVNVGGALGAAGKMGEAITLTDTEVQASARQMRQYEETNVEKVAPSTDKNVARLEQLVSKYKNHDDLNLNYKVYLSDEVNANASADGSVRVYTALMDMMTDDELLFVIGHEIGHVKLGHTIKAQRTALAMSGVKEGASAAGGIAGQIADSQLGGLLEAVLNAQYSQSQETDSDDYGLTFIKASGHDTKSAASALQKLAKLSGGQHSMLSSHPDPQKRAERIAEAAGN